MAFTGSVMRICGGARIAYFFFSVCPSFSLHLNLSPFFFRFRTQPIPQKSRCKYPFSKSNQTTQKKKRRKKVIVNLLAAPLVGVSLRAFPFGHVAMCTGFPFSGNASCMTHELIRAARPRPHARPHALH